MSNMSYCRFQNTAADLQDCKNALEDDGELSQEELRARNRLIKICVGIANDYGYLIANKEGAP